MDIQRAQNMTKTERRPRPQTGRMNSRGSKTEADAVGEAIGSRLKALYDEVADEPVPDRFLALLDQLAADDGKKGPGGGS